MTSAQSKEPEEPAIPNAHYEALLRMRTNNPSAWRVLSPNTKLAVLYYEAAKREHERIQSIRDDEAVRPSST